jgi:YidC/Oxa1 family membrane protein insertase
MVIPPPPAYGVGQRIDREARAAFAYSEQLRAAGNVLGADTEYGIAVLRAKQANYEYEQVVSSMTYGHTAFAAESELCIARLFRDIVHNQGQATQAFKTLHDNYAAISYPDKAVAATEGYALAVQVDRKNRTTPPMMYGYAIMNFLVNLTGHTRNSYWMAIVLVSVLVKLATWPLGNKQYKSMKEMQKLQPLVKDIQAKYKNDKELASKKMMELYKEHGVNPMGGCGPMLIQMPVMIALYQMIRLYQFQFQHGTFLWIGSPLSITHPEIFGVDLSEPDVPILLIYALTMYIQQRMVVPADPQQAEQQRMMAVMSPIMMTYMFLQYKLPSGLMLYYLLFSVLGMVQQKLYMSSSGGPATPGAAGSGSTSTVSASANGASVRNGQSLSPKNDDSLDRSSFNGSKPTDRGATPPKVHPKKKRR